MPDTNSLKDPERTNDETRLPAAATLSATDLCGTDLFECLGVGGMGEVYRCGDDALQRDLAVKILKAELRGDADAESRFLREARLTGSLQHPGIVPVHHLGRRADGRPCYTMKLVRGHTFAEMLCHEPTGPERLPRLLAVLEKMCQAMAFTHSKGVIHRDLKPSNVMVGEFGEVQVMDWGLAKELSRDEPATPIEATENMETVARTEEAEGLSRAGTALGTPAYMPPEQAAGDWDIVDERADVFALGAVLCEMLTGRPPYHGSNRDEMLRRARRGDMAEALGRLEKCGADAALVDLCRECLAAERLQRPRHAGVVAERLASYQAEVRERLRQAELEHARAEVKAREERKRRRLLAALALAGLLFLVGGVAVWRQRQQRRAEVDASVAEVLGETRLLRQEVQADPLTATAFDKAVSSARKARDLARAGGASESMQLQADELLAVVEREAAAATKDRQLLARLLDARGPRETSKSVRGFDETKMQLSTPTPKELFASAFRDWGLDVDAVPIVESIARLKACPPAMKREVIAALDEWADQRRLDPKPKTDWRRVAVLAEALDEEPNSRRQELRAILARDRLERKRALAMLSVVLRLAPVPVVVPLEVDHLRLRQLAEQMDPASEPILGLLTLTRALDAAGEKALAERLLRQALTARPREVVLHHTLGYFLLAWKRPAEAVEFYRAARALRPDLGVKLAEALERVKRQDEALDVLALLVKDNPFLHYQQAVVLRSKGDVDGAIACNKKAIELDPKSAYAHNGLGAILCDISDYDGAIVCFRKALEIDPKFANAHYNLGVALSNKHDVDGAIACYKKALELDPKSALAHHNLGWTLCNIKRDNDGAIVCLRKALELDPECAMAHINLGVALRNKDDLNGAIARFKKALELDPKSALAHCNLGHTLLRQGRFTEAVASLRRGHDLGSRQSGWRYPSLQWVREAERLVGLENKLPALMSGETKPANVQDLMAVARWATHHQQQFLATVRLLEQSLAANPDWAERLPADPPRYYAACCAAMAAAGKDPHASALDATARRGLRQQVVSWLGEELNCHRKQVAKGVAADRAAVAKALAFWKADGWLAAVRDSSALAELPADEQQACRKLWADVDELAKRVAAK